VLVLGGVMVAPRLVGFELEPVLSGSMEPNIHTGALIAIVKTDPGQLKEGDIIGFHAAGIDTPVCHRIFEIFQTDTGYGFTTKGDANDDVDPWTIAPQDVIGKIAFNISWFGYLAKFIKTPTGFIVMMGVPALAIVLLEIRNLLVPAQPKRQRPRLHQRPSRWPLYLPFIGGLVLLAIGWGMMAGNHTEKTLGSFASGSKDESGLKYSAERTMQNKGKLPLVICLTSTDSQISFSEDYFQLSPGQQKQVEISGYNQEAVIRTGGFFPLLPATTLYSLYKWNPLLAPAAALAVWIVPLCTLVFIVFRTIFFRPQLNRRVKYFRGALANE
jgi:signal peptidase I